MNNFCVQVAPVS